MSRRSEEGLNASRSKRTNPYQRAIERYDAIRNTLVGEVSNLLGAIEDDHAPNTGLSFIRRDDGGYLAIAKRNNDLVDQVVMAYGEDLIDALLNLNKKISAGTWKKDTPWKPPVNSGAGSEKK